ncbi:ABC transporter ATP-binding protein [Candidatus Parabeggiatoa sp. HSG14]|uniref:ABC transporter ATP-binding protein n=1 Tax=Candidatus Parabeggiatoa sp. HSG14 TaxID=3055593 RepID=UPI0025A73DAA|nr:ABC transporter ATP-binding protein [Thiotrichales bacterium HSG14]
MSVIEFKNVCKDYQKQQILNQIELQIQPGEFFGLVGVNGAGKTTLLKSLLNLCEIDKGSIYLFGTQHTNHNARAHLAFLPEQFVPPYYLTGENFLAYMAQLHNHIYDYDQVKEICQTLDLAVSALKQPVRDYSKGMAQKIGLAACFLSGKRLLVLDEPMTGLDPKARAYLKHFLLKLKSKEITLFFSTHLLADVDALCDRMAILHAGRLQFIGTPAECCTTFAAENLEMAYLNCIENVEVD